MDPLTPGMPSSGDVDRLLAEAVERMRAVFGVRAFRAGQERVVRALLAGRDVLAVMPTGSGKSLTYQLTSQVLPGATLVVDHRVGAPCPAILAAGAAGSNLERLAVPSGHAARPLRRARRGHRRARHGGGAANAASPRLGVT